MNGRPKLASTKSPADGREWVLAPDSLLDSKAGLDSRSRRPRGGRTVFTPYDDRNAPPNKRYAPA